MYETTIKVEWVAVYTYKVIKCLHTTPKAEAILTHLLRLSILIVYVYLPSLPSQFVLFTRDTILKIVRIYLPILDA
jgi:hypothetical protein